MNRQTIIEVLRRHEADLRAAGIQHLMLFGSVARATNSETSDVDLVAEFEPTFRRTLLTMVRLENQLADLLHTKVDLAPLNAMREPVRARALREAVHAF